jgi:glycosyltransferase involved in cell wall biosynthesis
MDLPPARCRFVAHQDLSADTLVVDTGSTPSFSAVIPAYNCERYVARAIRSVLAQRGVTVECIVVDDGSSDATVSLVERFGSAVRLIRQANAGAAAARNAGIAVSRAPYIAFLDADDFWLESKLLAQAKVLSANPRLPLVSTLWTWLPSSADPEQFDFSGPTPDPNAWRILPGWTTLLRDPYLCTPTVVVNAAVARACGGFDSRLPSAEDVDFFLRVCDGRPYALIEQPLVGCQLRQGSLTRTENSHMHNLAVLDRLAEARPDVAARYGDTLRAARLDIYDRWARGQLFWGRGARAREVLRQSQQVGQLAQYRRLWLKSYAAPAMRLMRDYLRPLAREDQANRQAQADC